MPWLLLTEWQKAFKKLPEPYTGWLVYHNILSLCSVFLKNQWQLKINWSIFKLPLAKQNKQMAGNKDDLWNRDTSKDKKNNWAFCGTRTKVTPSTLLCH